MDLAPKVPLLQMPVGCNIGTTHPSTENTLLHLGSRGGYGLVYRKVDAGLMELIMIIGTLWSKSMQAHELQEALVRKKKDFEPYFD